MRGTNVLFGQIAVVFGIVIIGVWSATQWTASALGYQVCLGAPWFDVSGMPIYFPWKLFEWWFVFDAYAPRVFNTGGMIAGGSGFVAVVVAIAMSVWRTRQSSLVTTYGSARWANITHKLEIYEIFGWLKTDLTRLGVALIWVGCVWAR